MRDELCAAPGRPVENGREEAFTTSDVTTQHIVNGVCYFDFDPSTAVPWQGNFNMRSQNLQATAGYQKGTSISMHKARAGCVTSTTRSLELLREYVQPLVNNEIRQVNRIPTIARKPQISEDCGS